MPAGDHVVFVHWVGPGGELLWTDDHEPPVPLQQWRAGHADRVRPHDVRAPHLGGRTGAGAGRHLLTGRRRRLPLTGEAAGTRAYPVATLEIRPDPSSVFVAFGDGWHNPEIGQTLGREWRWSRATGHLAFRNPQRPAELWLELDQPVKTLSAPQQVELRIGGTVVDTFTLPPGTLQIHRTPLSVETMGGGETVELEIVPSEIFRAGEHPGSQERRSTHARRPGIQRAPRAPLTRPDGLSALDPTRR